MDAESGWLRWVEIRREGTKLYVQDIKTDMQDNFHLLSSLQRQKEGVTFRCLHTDVCIEVFQISGGAQYSPSNAGWEIEDLRDTSMLDRPSSVTNTIALPTTRTAT